MRRGVPVLSTLSAAAAAVRAIHALSDQGLEVKSLQEYHRPRRVDLADELLPRLGARPEKLPTPPVRRPSETSR
jgi:hypothetical protein